MAKQPKAPTGEDREPTDENKSKRTRTPKVDAGSPKGILQSHVNDLSDTQAHVATKVLKNHFKDEHPRTNEEPDSLDVEAHNAIRTKLHGK